MTMLTYARKLTYEQVFVATNFYRPDGADLCGQPANARHFNGRRLAHFIRLLDDG